MSNTTTYINFSAVDYMGTDSLSSYALDLTPIKFIPDLDNSIHNRVVWSFGDGTISDSFSASKVYTYPGRYVVNMVVYDCDNNAQISVFEKFITIHDFVTHKFDVSYYPSQLDVVMYNGEEVLYDGEPIYFTPSGGYSLVLRCGSISSPLIINSYYPPYQNTSDIFYEISGSDSRNYWNIDNKFKHLENFNTLYDTIYNHHLGGYQYRPIPKIEFEGVEMYAKLSAGEIVNCPSTDEGSSFIGTSATKNIHINDDTITEKLLVKMFFDKNDIQLLGNGGNYLNNLGITLSAEVVDNPPNHLSITSNGLDGEGYLIDSFNINPIKYYNTNIPFVIRLKDADNFSIKNFEILQLSSLNLSAVSSGVYSISSLNYTLSGQNHGGSFRGYVTFPNTTPTTILENVKLVASGTFISDQLSSYTLSGESNDFNVYPSNFFDIYKKNEDFNPEQTIKDLRFQETLLDKEVLFGDFIGGVLGDEYSDHDGIGLKLYEKIANFIDNTQDLDKCEIKFLDSLGKNLNYMGVGDEKWILPENVKRLVNLLSINKAKLFGTVNKFKENLDVRGRTSKDEYGKNIGNMIDPKTYIVSVDRDIVALEKFSNTYTLLNSLQPLSSTNLSSFPLSTYSSDWGWPLVLPSTFNFEDIGKYYLFFDYDDTIDGTVVGGIIDFVNSKTTINISTELSALNITEGIYDNMILDTLYQSLSLTN